MTIKHVTCISLTLLLWLVFGELLAQPYNKTYRSPDNPYYWKNRKPHEAYWQQDVHYRIKARMNDNTNILDGSLNLTYYNNAPDTLTYVYFHLYQNAFLPGSHYEAKAKANGYKLRFGKYQKEGLGTQVENITVNGVSHEALLDNTIMRINLKKALAPGDSAVFAMNFRTWFNDDAGWGRMRAYKMWGFKHFNGAHWYPRMSVYDSRNGWTADQHLVHEFYGDFGTYEVELDFPDNYILEATGMLSNEQQMFPPDLRMKIALSNFADKPFGSAPSVIIPYDSTKRKVWKYNAVNVHDFAFVASPTYRISWVMRDGVRCVAIAHEPHAARWQDAADMTANIISIFSAKAGTYAYPKIVNADAFSGMEYPMLTMNSGASPDYAYIVSHEIGHNWFFGMVGSNETYKAFLDEGFTQYLTVIALEALSAKGPIESPDASAINNKYKKIQSLRDRHAYLRYIRHAVLTEGVQLNTHSDMFQTKSPYGEEYRQSYYKGAVMLWMLEYILGEDLFDKALKQYFDTWKFCHPYDDDLRNSFIQSTGVNLNWFFDEFLNTNYVADYSVKGVQKDTAQDMYLVSFERKGTMQLPIDFTIKTKNDSLLHFHIPNTDFVKNTTASVLPKWYGWLHFNPDYTARVLVPGGIKNVSIDTTHRLPDVYAPDNSLRPQVDLSFDYLIKQPDNLHAYELYYRPDAWWNGAEGLKAGLNVNGHYMNHHHVFDAYLWYNTGLLRVSDTKPFPLSFSGTYDSPIGRYNKKAHWSATALRAETFNSYAVKARYYINATDNHLYAEFKSLFRDKNAPTDVLLMPNDWSSSTDAMNNALALGYKHFYSNDTRNGELSLRAQTSFLAPEFDYSSLTAHITNNEKVDMLRLRTRFYARYTNGKAIPSESMLYLAGAAPDELIESKFTRSAGFVPSAWAGFSENTNRFHAGGGLNVRGYAGYLVAQEDASGNIIPVYKGHSGASVNAELEFDGLVSIKPPRLKDYLKINTYLFADAGVISSNALGSNLHFASLRASAGAGMALTVKSWGTFGKLKPFTIRFDVPFFLNRTPAIDNDFFNYRWMIGVGRAF